MKESVISLRETILDACTVPIRSMALDLTHSRGVRWGKKFSKNAPLVKHIEIMLTVTDKTHSSFFSQQKASHANLSPSKSEKHSPVRKSSLRNPMFQSRPPKDAVLTVSLANPKPNNYKEFPKREARLKNNNPYKFFLSHHKKSCAQESPLIEIPKVPTMSPRKMTPQLLKRADKCEGRKRRPVSSGCYFRAQPEEIELEPWGFSREEPNDFFG